MRFDSHLWRSRSGRKVAVRDRKAFSISPPLRFELLEGRDMLATFMVNNLADAGAGSLRQAILDANGMAGADTIQFASLSGKILLSTGEIAITEALTIRGPGDELVTIDAQQNSRIFNVTAATGDVAIDGLTLTGGATNGDNTESSPTAHSGGAIRSITSGNLSITNSTVSGNATNGYAAGGGGIFAEGNVTLTNSTVSGNRTGGEYAYGGGIFGAANVTLTGSTISGNRTTGDDAYGGGIFGDANVTLTGSTVSENHTLGLYASGGGIYATDDVTLTGSTVSGNHTEGENAAGGGINGGNVTLTDSTVSGNRTTGDYGYGGGIFGDANVTLTNSTVSENHTLGYYSSGGGIYAGDDVTITNSTISGNRTAGDSAGGGGIYCYGGDLTLAHSTVTGNRTEGADAIGGGLYNSDGATTLLNSIVTGNTATLSNPDLSPGTGPLTVRFSLIGDNSGTLLTPAPAGSPDPNGNLIGTGATPINPLLAVLADNGGPTWTHALLGGSPAIDAGDPSATAGVGNVPVFDQRGSPFTRVADGDGTVGARIDIGAFELQPSPPALLGDYNGNQTVDAADYVLWRKALGSTNDLRADGSGNGAVDQADYAVWRSQIGTSLAHVSGVESGISAAVMADTSPLTTTSPGPGTTAWRGRGPRPTAATAFKATDRDDMLLAWLAARTQRHLHQRSDHENVEHDRHESARLDWAAIDAAFVSFMTPRVQGERKAEHDLADTL
jgi:hypothetical protein